MAKRYTRKELKRPDQFQSFWQRVYVAVKDSTRPIIIGTGVTVALILGVSLYAHLSEKRSVDSSRALAHALRVLNSESTPQLEDPDAPKEKQDSDIPQFKSDKERKEAALKELDEVLAKWRSSGAGRDALLARGGILFDLGRVDDAIKDYQAFLQRGPRGNLKALGHEGLGYAYEAKGQLDQALAEFKKITSAGEFYRDRALYGQARILERKGDKAAAQKLYQEIIDKTPTTPLRDEITNRLALLGQ